MDPLSKAQELHTKLHHQLLAKDKQLALFETKVKEITNELNISSKRATELVKQHHHEMDEKDLDVARRLGEMEAREDALAEAEAALQAAQAQVDAERAAAKLSVENMETTVRSIESANLALTRERDQAIAANAVNMQHFHQQLVAMSQNHLDQTNEDIQRIAALRAESEQQKKDIASRFTDALVTAERTEADLRAQLASVTARADEDHARWLEQKKEFEAIITANAAELQSTVARVKESATKELTLLTNQVLKDETLQKALLAWDGIRADRESQWQQSKDECKFLRFELEKSIARYEQFEQTSHAATQAIRRELDETRKKLVDTEAVLAKKTQALQVYHREIKQNQVRLEEMKRAQQKQEQQHKEAQEKAAREIAALGGKAPAPKSQSGFGDVFSSLFKSSSDKEKAAQQAAQQAAAAAAAARKASNASDDSSGPRRSFSNADDEDLANTLNEEVAVSLSKRVESLEEDRLTLQAALDATQKRLKQAEMINALHSGAAANAGGSLDDSKRKDGSTPPLDDKEKKSLLGSVFTSSKDKKDPLNDPSKVRALLESQVRENQQLTHDAEKREFELKRLRTLLEGSKAELAEAQRAQKLLQATSAAKKNRKSMGVDGGAPSAESSPPATPKPTDVNQTL